MKYKRGLAKLWICKLHAFLLGNCRPAELYIYTARSEHKHDKRYAKKKLKNAAKLFLDFWTPSIVKCVGHSKIIGEFKGMSHGS